jgi:hypothetical protein
MGRKAVVNIGVPDVLPDVLVLVCVTCISDNARRGRSHLAALKTTASVKEFKLDNELYNQKAVQTREMTD